MAGVHETSADEGVREPRLALGWLTAVVLCAAWLVFARPAREPEPPPWEAWAIPKTDVTATAVPAVGGQAVVETPRPAPAAEPAPSAEAQAEANRQPAPPAAVPEGVGFGPGLGSRVAPEAPAKADRP